MLLPLATLMLFQSCGLALSDNIATPEFYATYEVAVENGAIQCSAYYNVSAGLGTNIQLGANDHVYCSNKVERVEMTSDNSHWPTYSAELQYRKNQTYEITLERAGEDPYVAEVEIPEAIKITAPVEGRAYPKNRDLNVLWNRGNGDSVDLDFSGTVNSNASYFFQHDVADVGRSAMKLVTDMFETLPSGQIAGEVTVERKIQGQHPSELRGTTEGIARDRVSFIWRD